jgi:hypothetical protein
MSTHNRLLSRLLSLDLVSAIKKWRRKYNHSRFVFESTVIYLSITKWNTGKCSISAGAFCDDPLNYVKFYQRQNFESHDDASKYLIEEGNRASLVFPEIDFYLELEDSESTYLHIQGGNMSETNSINPSQLCLGCGVRFVGVTGSKCPECGEPRYH